MYTWKKQLKTGMYYLRQKNISNPVKINNQQVQIKQTNDSKKFQCIGCE